jgi:hypothetical protein
VETRGNPRGVSTSMVTVCMVVAVMMFVLVLVHVRS